jgi:hypothetical protein
MNAMSNFANLARSEGDPKVISTGPSSLTTADRFGKALGWFSLGLGLMEILAPRTVTRKLGMEGHEGLIRAYGAREIGAGMLSLSGERSLGLWSRVAGDALDIATVIAVGGRDARKRHAAVGLTLAMLAGVAVIDLLAAQAVTTKHSRPRRPPRSYRDRSGYPQGLKAARGAAGRSRAGIRPDAKLCEDSEILSGTSA